MSLDSEEVRRLAIDLLLQETERDRQTRVGASDLANQCDKCLAAAFVGQKIRTPFAERYWLGRTEGTAMGLLWEQRARTVDGLSPEKHVWFGDIPGYGRVGGSIDLHLVQHGQVIDWKGSTRADIAILEDFLQARGLHRVGLPPRWEKQKDTAKYEGGYKFHPDSKTVVSLSATEYRDKMAKMAHKMDAYFGQTCLYCHSGVADRASIVFFARDGNGMYDTPGLDFYVDQSRKHDIFVWSFDYSREYAEALLRRGAEIWALLQGGQKIEEFDSDPLCFPCNHQQREAVQATAAEPDLSNLKVAA